MRHIFLDTETTGLYANQGHRIIEIAAIEIINRRLINNSFHFYVNLGLSCKKSKVIPCTS